MAVLPLPATIKSNGISFLIDFMGWVAKAAALRRRRSNPEGTYNNKVGHVAIFLKAFGVSVFGRFDCGALSLASGATGSSSSRSV